MTQSLFVYAVDLVIPASSQAQGNNLAQQLTGKPADAQTFQTTLNGLNASGSPNDPVTYLWTSPVMLAADYQTVKTVYAAEMPGSFFYCRDATSGLLLETNSPSASVGKPWNGDSTLADRGLKRITKGI